MPSRSCREKPLRLSGFRECVNTTPVSVRKRVHRPRINFASDRDSRIETGGRMNTPRERPNTGGGQASGIVDRIVQEFQEWLASVLQLFFEPRGAVAISAGPGLGAVLVPASAAVVGLPHLHQLKIPLPVRTLFLQRRRAVADFQPAYRPVSTTL